MSRLPLFQGINIPEGIESYIKYMLIKQQDPQLVTRILTVVIENTDNSLLLTLLYELLNRYHTMQFASIVYVEVSISTLEDHMPQLITITSMVYELSIVGKIADPLLFIEEVSVE